MADNPNRERPAKMPEQQRRLWTALHDYIRHHGGEVVSVPWHRTLRIEIPKSENSTLATKLTEAGYRPFHCGVTTRIAGGAFISVDVLEIDLPR